MKFDKFVKNVGTMGAIVEYRGQKWLWSGSMIALIPKLSKSLGFVDTLHTADIELPEKYERIIENSMEKGPESNAQLVDAFLPFPYDKPANIRRVFEDKLGNRIDISNKCFNVIEADDMPAILTCDIGGGTYPAALKVYDIGTRAACAYIFSEQYLAMLDVYEEEQA